MRLQLLHNPLEARTTGDNYTLIDFNRPHIEVKDMYRLPLKVGTPEVTFLTIPSNRHSGSWLPLAEACDVKGRNPSRPDGGYIDNCAAGELLEPGASSTLSQTPTKWAMQEDDANYYANGTVGTEKLVIGDQTIDGFGFNFAAATNASFGVLGLSASSALLQGMKDRGEIAARAFSLWMGADISYRQAVDSTAKSGSFPGSLVLGGYDFKRQQAGSDFLRGTLVNGLPRIQITGININNEDMMPGEQPVEAQIDTSEPHIYLPPLITQRMRTARENTFNDDLTLKGARKYGNVTMLLRVLDEKTAGARKINVTFPESIWDEDYSYVWSPAPSGKTFMPVMKRNYTTSILGRAFLKGVYLAINYDTSEFQIAPAGYNAASETDIQPFKAVDISNTRLAWPTASDETISTSSSSSSPGAGSISSTGTETGSAAVAAGTSGGTPTGAIAGGVVGGLAGIAIIGALIFFLLRRRRRRAQSENGDEKYDHEENINGFLRSGFLRSGFLRSRQVSRVPSEQEEQTAELGRGLVAEMETAGCGKMPELPAAAVTKLGYGPSGKAMELHSECKANPFPAGTTVVELE